MQHNISNEFEILLSEIRESRREVGELRNDFQTFRGKVLTEQGEQRGKNTVLAVVASSGVSALFMLVPVLAKLIFPGKN